MKFQGYFDDSGSSRKEPVYVLGGFISTVDKWKAFSDEWQSKLDASPSLAYFKMSEAAALKGQFGRGWNPALRDQRVFELAEIIAKHAMVRVDSWCYREPFDVTIKGILKDRPEFEDPYGILFYQLVFAIITFRLENGGTECDIIFDEQGIFPSRVLLYWDFAKSHSPRPERAPILASQSAPMFRNDRKFLPLQAADLFAWFVRNNRTSRVPGAPKRHSLIEPIGKLLRDVPIITRWYDHASMLEIGAKLMVWRAQQLGFLPN
jgi:hypothetical protein